jgi:L-threonylcarbamoyladenylate synthase
MKPDRIELGHLLSPEGENLLKQVAVDIKDGAVFVYPTETIYGIGGNTELSYVNEKIFNTKQRPTENPMIHLAAKLEVFSSLLDCSPPVARFLANTFWPGLLTIVVVTDEIGSGIAIRLSGHPFLMKLFEFVNFPIYSTSANVSGENYNPDPDYIYDTFKNKVNFMIDGGFLPPSAPSTVVKIESNTCVKVIREGVLSKVSIRSALENAGFSIDLK